VTFRDKGMALYTFVICSNIGFMVLRPVRGFTV
jgi:hypothetical protein